MNRKSSYKTKKKKKKHENEENHKYIAFSLINKFNVILGKIKRSKCEPFKNYSSDPKVFDTVKAPEKEIRGNEE